MLTSLLMVSLSVPNAIDTCQEFSHTILCAMHQPCWLAKTCKVTCCLFLSAVQNCDKHGQATGQLSPYDLPLLTIVSQVIDASADKTAFQRAGRQPAPCQRQSVQQLCMLECNKKRNS